MARTDAKGSAELRVWELDANSTRYDYLLAAPSDDQLTKYWTVWAVISLTFGLFVAVILAGVLSSSNARARPFNLYLIYLMIPDAIYSILCGIVCMLHAIHHQQVAELCNFQMIFIVWGVGSNMWLNAAVSQQLHHMLRPRRRYRIPTRRFVTVQAVAIYLFCIFLGTWGLIESSKFPHYVASTSGLACLPVEHDWKSSIFFWLVFFPLFGGIPVAYVCWVCFDIWKKGLLPPAGKRRSLVIYFGRIVFVFVCMWVPYMILLFMLSTWMPPWVHFYGGTLSHLQGAVSAVLSMLKPDIYFAVKRFVLCQYCREGDDKEQELEAKRRRSSWIFTVSARTLFARNNGDDSTTANQTSTHSLSSGRSLFARAFSRSRNLNDVSGASNDTRAEERESSDPESSLDTLWPDKDGNYSSEHTEESVNDASGVAPAEDAAEEDRHTSNQTLDMEDGNASVYPPEAPEDTQDLSNIQDSVSQFAQKIRRNYSPETEGVNAGTLEAAETRKDEVGTVECLEGAIPENDGLPPPPPNA